jgi:subtilase family serine protease
LTQPNARCFTGGPAATCPYTPAQLRRAYNIAPLLDQDIDGRGRTVVLLEIPHSAAAANLSNIYQDLAAYDRVFRLPSVSLTVNSRFAPGAAAEYADPEEVMDTEIVHAIAPGAHIQILLAGNGVFHALAFSPVNQLGDVISISMGFGEQCITPAGATMAHHIIERAAVNGITMVASSGDVGAVANPCRPGKSAIPVAGVNMPASDPLVTAVGGTGLSITPNGRYQGETAWNTPPRSNASANLLGPDPFGGVPHSEASGGGFSRQFRRPAYQNGVPGIPGGRGLPDVAASADLAPGIAAVIVHGSRLIVAHVGGTSAGAPLWAGLAALADQDAGRRLGPLNPALYRIAEGPEYHSAFHDVTVGNNSAVFPSEVVAGQQAGPGWDAVTGWGSPNAAVLVTLLKTQ